MALALTEFRALCGFLPLPRIATYLSAVPEFAALIPKPIATHFLSVSSLSSTESKSALKNLFSALMSADRSVFTTQLRALTARYRNCGASSDEENVVSLVLLLESQFPDDIGVFCAFVLNYVHMMPGEAIFLGAGEPHAYISGGASSYFLP
jgi:mannose-6-phosphate isomerase